MAKNYWFRKNKKKIEKKKYIRLNSLKILENLNRKNLVLESPEKFGKSENLNKSQILQNNEYIKENNERKRKYSLELSGSINIKNNDSNSNLNTNNELNKNNLNHYIKKNINKNTKKSKEKYKKKENTDNKSQNRDDKDISESDEEILSFLNKNNYINKNQYNALVDKIKKNPNQIGIKKNFYFNRYNMYKRSNTSININISSLKINNKNNTPDKNENNALINLTKFLLEKYKLNDEGKYTSENSNIKEDIKNEQLNEEDEDNNSINSEDKFKDYYLDEEERVVLINLFGLNIKVRNIKNALKNYLIKRKLTLTELYQLIQRKNNLSKLIIKLEKEKKEKRRKKRKSKKSILDIRNNNLDILKFFNNVDKSENENINKDNEIKKQKEKKVETQKDIEKRKMRLLLKFKNDINYKIKTGDMNVSDIDIFSKMQEKLDKLMNFYNINENEKKIEDFAGDFHEEMELFEQRKKDERIINAFINDLYDQINYKSKKKKVIEDTFCNVVNYDSVNRMNILNKI